MFKGLFSVFRTCGFCLAVWGNACRVYGGLLEELETGLIEGDVSLIEAYGEASARAIVGRFPTLRRFIESED